MIDTYTVSPITSGGKILYKVNRYMHTGAVGMKAIEYTKEIFDNRKEADEFVQDLEDEKDEWLAQVEIKRRKKKEEKQQKKRAFWGKILNR